MSRAMILINSPEDRQKCATWASKVPLGTRVEWKAPKRTLPQNDRMWAMLTDLSLQLAWHGQRLAPDDWKLVMLDALRRETREQLRIVPNTDGTGFVNLSTSSSDLSKDEMTTLIEIIFAFGAAHGVEWSEPQQDNRGVA